MVKLKSLARRALESVRRSSPWDNQEPIREELFSVERLEEHARSLALAQIVSSRTTKDSRCAAARRQRRRSARGLSLYRRGDQRGSRDNAGGGVARRQLSSRREANSRDSLGPAARLLPPASQARLGSFRRLSSRVRHGLGFVAIPIAASMRRCWFTTSGVSGGATAHDRRTLGGVDHAADRTGRKSRTPRAADHAKPRGPTDGGRPRRPFARDRGRPPNPSPSSFSRTNARRFRKLSRFSSCIGCATRIEDHAGADMARPASGASGRDNRRGGARRSSPTRRFERHGAQHHQQLAPDFRCRLETIVRAAQSRRRCLCRRQPI